jgi:hypothetical protein
MLVVLDYVNITDGSGKLSVVGLSAGDYTAVVRFIGDDKYAALINSTKFSVISKESVDIGVEVGNGTVEITLPGNATGNVTVVIDGENYTFYNIAEGSNRTIVVNVSDLAPGNHSVEVIYSGDDNYAPASNYTNVEVPKVTPDVDIVCDDNCIVVELPDDASGNVTVVVDGKGYTVPVVNGTVLVPNVNGGNHSVEVIYSGDDKYDSFDYNGTVDVGGVRIIAPNVVKFYHGPERLVVYVLDNDGDGIAGIEIKFTINGVTYSRITDVSGVASIAINLSPGNYPADVVVGGYDFDVDVNVEVKHTIYAEDVVKVFRNGTQYYGLFLDGEGNPLVNTNVSFNINGVFYTRTTNATGWARLNINLEKGEYILTAMNPVTGENRSNIISVYTSLQTHDLIKYYRNASQFVARVVAPDGSYAGAGEKVTFNINGVFYTSYTNATGHIVLNINLEPGDYIVTGYYEDCVEGNLIRVLPVLSAKDMSMSYLDGSKFTARVLDGQGRSYANQNVTFNINGVFYIRTTDSSGEAKLNINLQAGEYIITSTYNGASISNKITISV